MTTAGHCGDGHADTNSQVMGPIERRHVGGGQFDFELIDTSSLPDVWGDTEPYYTITGIYSPAPYATVALDGSFTGERDGVTVVSTDQCITYSDPNYGTIEVCDADSTSSSTRACSHGDSGSPVIRRISSTSKDAYAVGTLLAVNSSGTRCWFQLISPESSITDTHLATR